MERDFFDELGDTITKATKNLGKKANEFYETQKIRGRISSEEHMIRKLKCDIGNLIYEKYKDGEMPEKALKGFCEEICQHEQIIKGYEETAADMKGKKICPECGKYVDKKAAFCSWCGAVCPTEKKEKPEEEPSSEEAGREPETAEQEKEASEEAKAVQTEEAVSVEAESKGVTLEKNGENASEVSDGEQISEAESQDQEA